MSLYCCLRNKATRQSQPEIKRNCRSYRRKIGIFIFQATGILQALNRKGISQCSPKNCLPGLSKCFLLQGIQFLIPSSVAVRLQWLPYIFKDPHKLDKKIDPKKLQFGSRIDENSGQREEYYSVKEVISPELIRLSNGLLVRLIGVRENKALNGLAVNFITGKTKGEKVFLKFDSQKHDNENH